MAEVGMTRKRTSTTSGGLLMVCAYYLWDAPSQFDNARWWLAVFDLADLLLLGALGLVVWGNWDIISRWPLFKLFARGRTESPPVEEEERPQRQSTTGAAVGGKGNRINRAAMIGFDEAYTVSGEDNELNDIVGVGRSEAAMQGGPRVDPWHSKDSDRHHLCANCNTGKTIEKEDRLPGSGGKMICIECRGWVAQGKC